MTNLKLQLLLTLLILGINISFSQTWVQQSSGTTLNLNSVYFIDVNTGYIGTDSGKVLKTTNGGVNWFISNTNINRAIYSVLFVNAVTGFASTDNKVLKTTNAGLNWDTTINGGGHSISFINSTTGYSAKRFYSFGLWKTTNSGTTWDSVSFIFTTNSVWKIFFVNEIVGYAAGSFWTMSFGGLYQAIIWKSTNSGFNWNGSFSSVVSGSYAAMKNLYFVNTSVGYSVGFQGDQTLPYFYKTSNSGVNWTSSQIIGSMNSLKFLDANTGWLCGDNGRIIYSTNAGTSWFEQQSNTNRILNDINMINSNTGYIAGENGTILKTTNGGTTAIEPYGDIIPVNYSLSQNYPNPFNPSTLISFDIPKTSYVSLVVYDQLGREIEQLVNDELKPGTYKYDWNASQYPSGIYFYKLQAGEFIETKKMVLVK